MRPGANPGEREMPKKLVIDLEICDRCSRKQECPVQCSYMYHPGNNGVTSVRELASFAIYCRKCEEADCVTACPKEALEKQENGMLKRYNMRCISCKSCSWACPFGTILPEVIPYAVSCCDYCLGRADDNMPDCIPSCPEGALKYEDREENEEEMLYAVGENLLVRSPRWEKVEKELRKK